jgi:hypothetical protein
VPVAPALYGSALVAGRGCTGCGWTSTAAGVSRRRPIGVDIGERGPGQGFGRFLAARLLLGHARIGLCVLARRQRLGVLDGLRRGLRDGSVGILLRRRSLQN